MKAKNRSEYKNLKLALEDAIEIWTATRDTPYDGQTSHAFKCEAAYDVGLPEGTFSSCPICEYVRQGPMSEPNAEEMACHLCPVLWIGKPNIDFGNSICQMLGSPFEVWETTILQEPYRHHYSQSKGIVELTQEVWDVRLLEHNEKVRLASQGVLDLLKSTLEEHNAHANTRDKRHNKNG